MSIKDLVRGKSAKFTHYQDGNLWYTTEGGFDFPIPIEDTKGGVFKAEDKAIFFMRWIRKHKERVEKA